MPDRRQVVTGFALARIGFGAGLIAAPGRVASGWLGEDASRQATQIAIRAVGTRDIALAAGAAIRAGGDDRAWLLACAAGDLSDIGSTLAAGEAISSRARWGTVALAGTAAVIGLVLAAAAGSEE